MEKMGKVLVLLVAVGLMGCIDEDISDGEVYEGCDQTEKVLTEAEAADYCQAASECHGRVGAAHAASLLRGCLGQYVDDGQALNGCAVEVARAILNGDSECWELTEYAPYPF